jgi:hypothetical protein
VEVGGRRSPESWGPLADAAVRRQAVQTARLSQAARTALRRAGHFPATFSLPTRVVLTDGGRPLTPETPAAGALSLVFETSGGRSFPAEYRQRLQDTFDAARPTMDALFGEPAVGGALKVKNYDADIQDRYAVAGGYFVANAPGGREVRFPVYNSPVAASVNFIHTLLLAYLHPTQPKFDAYAEGLVRATTARVARVPGAVPGATPDQVEAVLEGLYDVGPFYDWYNSPSIGAPRFIAPNLLDLPLPPGGSTGGVFLLRYQMAGTCWLKLLAERPAFARAFRDRYDAAPGSFQTQAALEALGLEALRDATGVANPTVEGLSYPEWVRRQAILDCSLRPGLKLAAQPFPSPPIPGSADFGLFGVVLNGFSVGPDGSESLLSGDCWPLYLLPDFARTFLSAQEDLIQVSAGFGGVVVNFPAESFVRQPYRMAVDLPFRGAVARCWLPAGAVATGAVPEPNDFYGTLAGFPDPGGAEYQVVVDWLGGRRSGIRVRNFAFGAAIGESAFARPGPLIVRVYRVTSTGQTLLLTRKVNKTQGPIALDLRPPAADASYTLQLRNGLQTLGLPLDPYRPEPAEMLGLLPGDTLWARWNPLAARHDLYPREGGAAQGAGYWARPPSAAPRSVGGRVVPGVPVSVALNPGWNMVSAPFDATSVGADIQATTTTEAFRTLAEAQADGILGPALFRFEPDSSAPDEGALVETDRVRPGEATWVRCDRADGAVLLFVPRSSQRPTFESRLERDSRARGTMARAVRWEAALALRQGSRTLGSARIGAGPSASRGYDPRLDTASPGSLAPARMAVWGSGSLLYRDIRRTAFSQRFELRLNGLRPGVRYEVACSMLRGRVQLAAWRGGRRTAFGPSRSFAWTAGAASETVEVEAVDW